MVQNETGIESLSLRASLFKFWQILLWTITGYCWLIWAKLFCIRFGLRILHLFGKPISSDPPCNNPECDFGSFWPAGLLARSGDFHRIYDPSSFLIFQQHFLAPYFQIDAFLYPPFVLLPMSLLSFLPFNTAFFAWTIVYCSIAGLCLRRAGLSWQLVLASLLCPAAMWNIEIGQFSVLLGSLLVAGLLLFCQNRFLAGMFLGLLGLKPQEGVLLPIVLLGARGWRVAGVIIGVLSLLLIATLICFGPNVWNVFEQIGQPYAVHVLQAAFVPFEYFGGGVSVFWMVRSLGAGLSIAYIVQGGISICAALICFRIWRRRIMSLSGMVAATVMLSLLATPYGFLNDMFAGSVMLAVMVEKRNWKLRFSYVLFWLWPCFGQFLTIKTGVLFTPAVILGALWGILRDEDYDLAIQFRELRQALIK